jgi:hypothetical protein
LLIKIELKKTRKKVEDDVSRMFGIPIDSMHLLEEENEYMSEVAEFRKKDVESRDSYRKLMMDHEELLKAKSDSKGFDMYEFVEEKEEPKESEAKEESEEKELTFFDDLKKDFQDFNHEIDNLITLTRPETKEDKTLEKNKIANEKLLKTETKKNIIKDVNVQMDVEGYEKSDEKKEGAESVNLEDIKLDINAEIIIDKDFEKELKEMFRNRFTRIEELLKMNMLSDDHIESEFAINILSSEEFKKLKSLAEQEELRTKKQMKTIVDSIMRKIEKGTYKKKKEKRTSVHVNELLDEQTMINILGKDVVEELHKTLRDGVVNISMEDLENSLTSSVVDPTDLMNSYFFVGRNNAQ